MKSPAFQLYASDFYMDTAGWSATEVGAYFRLLMYEWVNGSVPNSPEKLARISQVTPKSWLTVSQSVLLKFVLGNSNTLHNPRLEREREKQLLWRDKSSLGGSKAQANRQPLGQPNGQPNVNQKSTLQSSSSSSKLGTKPPTPFEKGEHKKPNNRKTRRLAVGSAGDAESEAKAHARNLKNFPELGEK